MTRDDAIKEIDNLRNDIGSAYDDADQSPMWYALGMAIVALEENAALRLLIDWAEQCGFGYDNFPEEYEQYKNEIEEKNLGYIEGMIYIAKKVTEGDNES